MLPPLRLSTGSAARLAATGWGASPRKDNDIILKKSVTFVLSVH